MMYVKFEKCEVCGKPIMQTERSRDIVEFDKLGLKISNIKHFHTKCITGGRKNNDSSNE